MDKIKIAVFASGNGSNAQNLYEYLIGHPYIEIALIVTDRINAGVVDRFHTTDVPILMINRTLLNNTQIIDYLSNCHWIVLAGFLSKIPKHLIDSVQGRILNLHPSLLPKYGGKGMYGIHVHRAVIAAKETESGITIHRVNEAYDEGSIIAQFRCEVDSKDTPETLAQKIHELEYQYFPKTIVETILNHEIDIQ